MRRRCTPLLTGLRAVRALRAQLRTWRSFRRRAASRSTIGSRQKEREFQQAILLANSVRIEALADDGVVVPGQPVRVPRDRRESRRGRRHREAGDVRRLRCARRVHADGGHQREPVRRAGPGGLVAGAAARRRRRRRVSTLTRNQVAQCAPTMTIPASARASEPYWHRAGEAGRYTFDADAPFGLPYRPTPFRVQRDAAGRQRRRRRRRGRHGRAVPLRGQHLQRREAIGTAGRPGASGARLAGDRDHPGCVDASSPSRTTSAPARRAPRQTRRRPRAARDGRERRTRAPPRARVASRRCRRAGPSTSASTASVKLHARGRVADRAVPGAPAAGAAAGEYHVKAIVRAGGAEFTRGYQVIEYPHIRRQHIYRDADVDAQGDRRAGRRRT